MYIWIVNPFDSLPGETSRHGRYWTLAETLAQRGHQVIWWSSNFSHRFKEYRDDPETTSLGFSIRLIPTRRYDRNISLARVINHRQFSTGFLKSAQESLRDKTIEPPNRIIVSVPPLSTLNAAYSIRNRTGCKVIVDIQDLWPEAFYAIIAGPGAVQQSMARAICMPLHLYMRCMYKRADAITAVAMTYIQLTGTDGIGIPSRMTPIGTSLRTIDAILPEERQVEAPLILTYTGALSVSYDLGTVIRAIHVLVERGVDIRLIIAGRGPNEEKLERLAISLGLDSAVSFRGYLRFEEVVGLLGYAHIGLNLARPESYGAIGNKVADYLAAGLPVINCTGAELATLLRKHEAGQQYSAGNVDSAVEAIEKYAHDFRLVVEHGRNARHLAESMFAQERTYPAFAEFIESL